MNDTPPSDDGDSKYDRRISNEEYIETVANRFKLRCSFCNSNEWEQATYDFDNLCIEFCSDCHIFDDSGWFRPIRHS